MNMFKNVWRGYNNMLIKKPLLTQALTSGSLFMLGDVISQKLDGTMDNQGYDYVRGARGFLWSSCIFTPIAHPWYAFLAKTTIAKSIAGRVLLDQFGFALGVNALFLSYSAYTQGQNVEEKLKQDYFNIMKTNWLVWIPVQMINFKYVPPHLALPFINCVVVGWSAYLATMGSKKVKIEE